MELPLIVLFLFGLYSIYAVLKKVFSFNDCEKEYDQFLLDVQRAEKNLLSNGITFSKDYKKLSSN